MVDPQVAGSLTVIVVVAACNWVLGLLLPHPTIINPVVNISAAINTAAQDLKRMISSKIITKCNFSANRANSPEVDEDGRWAVCGKMMKSDFGIPPAGKIFLHSGNYSEKKKIR